MRWMGDAIDAMRPPGEPLDAVFVGGGGFTLPRYLAATRPGSRSRVLEVDRQLVDLARDELGLRTGPDLRVASATRASRCAASRTRSADVVVGDAFGGRSIPWHLATREFAADVRRVLRPDGIYLLNVIDYGELDLVRAEAATLLRGVRRRRARRRAGPAPPGRQPRPDRVRRGRCPAAVGVRPRAARARYRRAERSAGSPGTPPC